MLQLRNPGYGKGPAAGGGRCGGDWAGPGHWKAEQQRDGGGRGCLDEELGVGVD